MLVQGAEGLIGADWAAVLDCDAAAVVASVGEDVPSEKWLSAFVAGVTAEGARGDHDELSAEALVSLTRALWSIEDALEIKMRLAILRGDKNALESVPNFIARLKGVEEECYKDLASFRLHNEIPRSIMIAICTIGTTIRSSFYNYE